MEEREELLTISELEEVVKLPLSTIRFYETEFPLYLRVQKTSGGHRRYTPENVKRFLHLKGMIHDKGMSLREVKHTLAADADPDKIREEMDLLLKVTEELTRENQGLRKSLEEMANRITALEEEVRGKKASGFKWFR